MKWLEIIELRTANRLTKQLKRSLHDLVYKVAKERGLPKISVFSSFAIDGDFSIHLIHYRHPPTPSGSVLGIHIADALKSYGMVNHQIWCGIEEGKNKQRELI